MKVLCTCSGQPGLSSFKVRMQGSCEGLFFNGKEWYDGLHKSQQPNAQNGTQEWKQ
jgi:hypothetical protein